jgi:micrococcal nuclease
VARARWPIVAAGALALVVMTGAYVGTQLLGRSDEPGGSRGTPAVRGPGGHTVPQRPADAQPMTVREVHDGDTVWLQAARPGAYVGSTERVKVRLIGVDTPEVAPTAECFGQQATDHLDSLISRGSTVYVTADREPTDSYDRLLLYLWTPAGEFVNYTVVAEGWGEPLRVYPNVAHWPLLRAAGAEAERTDRGLWGAC